MPQELTQSRRELFISIEINKNYELLRKGEFTGKDILKKVLRKLAVFHSHPIQLQNKSSVRFLSN